MYPLEIGSILPFRKARQWNKEKGTGGCERQQPTCARAKALGGEGIKEASLFAVQHW
jgi:hypothetical protein